MARFRILTDMGREVGRAAGRGGGTGYAGFFRDWQGKVLTKGGLARNTGGARPVLAGRFRSLAGVPLRSSAQPPPIQSNQLHFMTPFMCPVIGLACLTAAVVPHASAATSATAVTDEDLLLARNPVVIRTRLASSNEFTELGAGGHRNKLIAGGVYGFGLDGQNRNFGIGFEMSYWWDDPKGAPSGSGWGDFKLRYGYLFRGLPEGWRAGLFGDTEFDTSADAVQAAANQRHQMMFGAGIGIPIGDRFVVTTTLQYGWSLEAGETNGQKAEWEGHLVATWKATDWLAVNLDYKVVLNNVGRDEVFNTLEPSLGTTLGADKNIGLWTALECPLDNSGTDWVAKIGMTWFF